MGCTRISRWYDFLNFKGNTLVMSTIHVSSAEETLFRDFKEGNSVQFRVTVSPENEKYEKGQTVKVVCGKDESTGKIVSDPLVVRTKAEDGKETISLVVEKAD